MREAKALARSCVHAGSSEPPPHAYVIRTIISCAVQFIVLTFHCGPFLLYSFSVFNLNSKHFETLSERIYLVYSRQSPCYPNSFEMPFSNNGLRTTTGIQVFSQVNKYTLSYRFLYGNAQGCVFA